ncbi:hypothetical protein ACQR07_26050 [Bradyrhizobium sp. HKCCYLS20291]
MAYVLVIGGYLGFVIHRYGFEFAPPQTCEASALTFPVPIICFLFSLVIIQHHLVINDLAKYLSSEWPRNLDNGVFIVHWDNSETLRSSTTVIQAMRTVAQCSALCVPFLFELFANAKNFLVVGLNCSWMIVLNIIVPLVIFPLIVAIHVYAHWVRVTSSHRVGPLVTRVSQREGATDGCTGGASG